MTPPQRWRTAAGAPQQRRRDRRSSRWAANLSPALLTSALALAVTATGCAGGPTADEAAGRPTPAPATTARSTIPPPTTTAPTTAAPTTAVPAVDPDALAAPTEAAEVLELLVEAERAVRDPALDDDTAAAWGRLQQRLYGTIASDDELTAVVTAEAPDDLRPAIGGNLEARRALGGLVTSTALATELPPWRIRAPLGVDELLGHYARAEAATGVGWQWLAAIHLVETRMGRIEGTSTAGAIGPMQFLPSTWAECCEGDPLVDADAILGAATYLSHSGAPADMAGAVFRYNRSERYVRAITAYAQVLAADPTAYRGYWSWEVYFRTDRGLIRLLPGYAHDHPVAIEHYLAVHPHASVPETPVPPPGPDLP
jgi:hypothetical protein